MQRMSFDPVNDPLDLPVQKWRVHCALERPLAASTNWDIPSFGIRLRGALNHQLSQLACLGFFHGRRPCEVAGNGFTQGCLHPEACLRPYLLKPRSPIDGQSFSSPVFIEIGELTTAHRTQTFCLDITLWGDMALGAHAVLLASLNNLAGAGLKAFRGRQRRAPLRVGYRLVQIDQRPMFRLSDKVRSLEQRDWHEIELTCEALIRNPERPDGDPLPIARLMADSATKLQHWSLIDRGLAPRVSRQELRDYRNRIARAALRAGEGLILVQGPGRVARDAGWLRSASTGYCFPLGRARSGRLLLRGAIREALPWLVLLATGRSGQRVANGFGKVRVALRSQDEALLIE
jgi:hypothetical protein